MAEKEKLLEINDLTIQFVTKDMGTCKAVNHVSFTIEEGETLGLVGETGAGKTSIALGILHLIQQPPGQYVSGSIKFRGEDTMTMSAADLRKIRGNKISMIFQDPMTALNPVDTVGEQIAEVIKLHEKCSSMEATAKAKKMLELVGIPAERYGEYPHQFSGGMKQRVVIAMALACSPELLIADEPTTALDVTIQAQVLDMIRNLKEATNTSMLLITHDLGVVAETCNKVAIIYAGEIVEFGTADHIFRNTSHPYTQGLFDSLPDMAAGGNRLKPIKGLMPDPSNLPVGCKFAPRCDYCTQECADHAQELTELEPGHMVRCGRVAQLWKEEQSK